MIRQSFIIPIIKVTDSCNYSCDFCYYAQRKLHSPLMSRELCKKIIRECFLYNLKQGNNKMRIIFHGGEPLLQPLSFYEEIVNFEKKLAKDIRNFEFFNSIQTNGYHINQRLVNFFKQESFDIGISIDGPCDLNNHYNKEEGQNSCSSTVLNNILLLQNANLPFGIISVITNNHLSRALDIYNFCKDNNFHDLSLNYCYNSEILSNTVENAGLQAFLKELFDLYFYGDYELNIREFNEMIAKAMGYCTDTCATCDRKNCGQYLSFDMQGNVFFCDSGYDKTTRIGNIIQSSIYEVLDSFDYIKKYMNVEKYTMNFVLIVMLRIYVEVVATDMIL